MTARQPGISHIGGMRTAIIKMCDKKAGGCYIFSGHGPGAGRKMEAASVSSDQRQHHVGPRDPLRRDR